MLIGPLTDASAATMTSVDRYGFEMTVTTEQGPKPLRLAFAAAPFAARAEDPPPAPQAPKVTVERSASGQ